jgi:luciferase family oxidoreductase group 1
MTVSHPDNRRMPMNTRLSKTRLSMLDLVGVREGYSVAQALEMALITAQKADSLGFTRYWLAEHHNMPGIASSATAVLIGHVAAGTQRIRVGSGGIMLPNHAPLTVAEAFGTLAELYPGRIDLGIGRAPGTDGPTMRALRRDRVESVEDFPRDVAELERLLARAQPGQAIVATPGAGTEVPIWLLGSSLYSAQLAAQRGLPYAFASHFAPGQLLDALAVYRSGYQPSQRWPRPQVIVGVPVIAAPTDDEAQYLASSVFQRVHGIVTGQRGKLKPPQAGFLQSLPPAHQAAISDFLAIAVIGGPETVHDGFARILDATQADEIMIVCDVFELDLRLRSLEIVSETFKQ